MAELIQPVKGMNDVLADQAPWWNRLESVAHELFASYGYQRVRLPVLERTELFSRSIGELTDIVSKEMFTFDDHGDSLTLRPEATAGVVRAALSNGLLHNQQQKLWLSGPMFRREKPQKGRYRQFHQMSVEALGFADAGDRRRADRDVRAAVARPRFDQREARAQHDRHCRVAPEVQASARRALLAASRAARRRQPAAARPQSAADPRQQEPEAARAHRRSAAVVGPSRRRIARALRAGASAARRRRRRLSR